MKSGIKMQGILLLPFVILYILIGLLPPWQESGTGSLTARNFSFPSDES